LPIKRNDAEPLTREDVQFDLLDSIFHNPTVVFTNPISGGNQPKMSFGDLYISALYNSSKCSKVLKEKMLDTPLFSIEFAKISLLTNVGRINTTMACKNVPIFHISLLYSQPCLTVFPEMKTALRTYHPVPSLQKSDGNAQDAPRIKNCLKAALLPSELKGVAPSTPEEVLEKRVTKFHGLAYKILNMLTQISP
jgi:Ino eighty subunit 1